MDFVREIVSSAGGEFRSFLFVKSLCAIRIFFLLSFIPIFGAMVIQRVVRISLAIVLSISFAPALSIESFPSLTVTILYGLKEAAIGFSLGCLVSIPFYFIQQSGFLMDASRGGAASSLLSPFFQKDSPQTPFSILLLLLSAVIFFATPVSGAFWFGLDASFDKIPVYPFETSAIDFDCFVSSVVSLVSSVFLSSILLAFPALIVILLADLTVGFIGRFSPASGSYFVSLPVRTAAGVYGGLIVLLFASPVIEKMLLSGVEVMNKIIFHLLR